MKYTLVISIILQILPAPVATYHGTLMYVKAGFNDSVNDLWLDPSASDTTDLYSHRLPLRLLINDGEFFRSPLIEQWDDLEVTWVELNLYNDEGGWMGNYHFEGPYPGEMDLDFVQTMYLRDKVNTEAITNVTYGPSIYVHKTDNDAYFSFMAIQLADNMSPVRGSQFMVSVDSFNYLPSAGGDHYSCAHIPVFGDIIDVTAVFQCTYHCMTVSGCLYYGIYTNSTSNDTRHQCVPLFGQPAYTKQDCDIVCPDNRPCGREYVDLNSLVSVSADVYSMVPGVHNDLMAMQTSNTTRETYTYYINAQSSIDLGSKMFIGGINVRGPGAYTLLLFRKSCEDLFDEDLQGEEDLYHGFYEGSIKTFQTDAKHTFAPVLARCLYFNTTEVLQDRAAEVSKVTNKFLLADYLTVQAEWNKAACMEMEVMSRKDFIPDTAIEISQSPPFIMDFANGNTYIIPSESYCIMEISLPLSFTEPWIRHFSVQASENVAVTTEVHSHRKCTNQTTGSVHNVSFYEEVGIIAKANILTNETFDELKFDNNPTFCADNFTVIIKALSPLEVSTFNFSLGLYGCVIDPGLTVAYKCQTINLLESYYAEVIGWLEPRPKFAYDALRPNGRGLQLRDVDSDVFVTIRLSQNSPVELRRVLLAGSLMSVYVKNGEEVRFGTIIDGYPIQIEFPGVLTHNVTVFDIQRDYFITTGQSYLNLTVEIYVCVKTNATAITPSPSTATTANQIPSLSATQHTVTPPTDTTITLRGGLSNQSVSTHPNNLSNVTTSYSELNTSEKTTTAAQMNPSQAVETPFEETTIQDRMTISSIVSYSQMSTSHQTTVISNKPFTARESVFKTSPTDNTSTFPRNTEMLSSTATSPDITTDPQSGDTVGSTKPATEVTGDSGTGRSVTAGVTTETTHKTEETTKSNVDTELCRCSNKPQNLTSEELDVIVAELVRNLTVPVERTAMFRRSKVSMPDKRRSSVVIGSVGIACMVAVGGVIVIMDIDHILKALNFVKTILKTKPK